MAFGAFGGGYWGGWQHGNPVGLVLIVVLILLLLGRGNLAI